MANSDNRGSNNPDAPRPLRHRDAQAPVPDTVNPKPSAPGSFESVQGMQTFEKLKATGEVPVPWAVDRPLGRLPAEANDAPLASFVDVSPPRPPDPIPTNSPPAPMELHPHLAARAAKKG